MTPSSDKPERHGPSARAIWAWGIGSVAVVLLLAAGAFVVTPIIQTRRAVERCWHAVPADIHLYIAGQKMWDGSRSMEDIALDYLGALYGAHNAAKVWAVYRTLVRCKSAARNGWKRVAPKQIAELAAEAAGALKLLRSVKIHRGRVPAISTPNTPQGYILDLERDLKDVIVRHYMMENGGK